MDLSSSALSQASFDSATQVQIMLKTLLDLQAVESSSHSKGRNQLLILSQPSVNAVSKVMYPTKVVLESFATCSTNLIDQEFLSSCCRMFNHNFEFTGGVGQVEAKTHVLNMKAGLVICRPGPSRP